MKLYEFDEAGGDDGLPGQGQSGRSEIKEAVQVDPRATVAGPAVSL